MIFIGLEAVTLVAIVLHTTLCSPTEVRRGFGATSQSPNLSIRRCVSDVSTLHVSEYPVGLKIRVRRFVRWQIRTELVEQKSRHARARIR
jgi:hypothetical protein